MVAYRPTTTTLLKIQFLSFSRSLPAVLLADSILLVMSTRGTYMNKLGFFIESTGTTVHVIYFMEFRA